MTGNEALRGAKETRPAPLTLAAALAAPHDQAPEAPLPCPPTALPVVLVSRQMGRRRCPRHCFTANRPPNRRTAQCDLGRQFPLQPIVHPAPSRRRRGRVLHRQDPQPAEDVPPQTWQTRARRPRLRRVESPAPTVAPRRTATGVQRHRRLDEHRRAPPDDHRSSSSCSSPPTGRNAQRSSQGSPDRGRCRRWAPRLCTTAPNSTTTTSTMPPSRATHGSSGGPSAPCSGAQASSPLSC